ncbi:TPA: hypothetical protein DCW38_02145 [candidate division WOR-3 bacterium]|jgi:uncharacterized lipoprotein YddW (UPF0748 family)|uniref:Glycosyl hydrolase-like 10 domain-containing protein n=1 Tax=candidate division WOR-3 bacterium TaxID=2052148 RepID=A0A350H8U9_UNCW3|nr:hypothetical protein [candidate division WOR-3 bacterium]
MNKIKSPFLWAFLLFVLPIFIHAVSIKGVWITRWDIYSESHIYEIIDSLSKANVTDAFVQIYGSGTAYYDSKIAPKKYADFDPLSVFVSYAHEKNIRVHAWVNLLYMWDRQEMTDDEMHIVNRYPESVLVDDKNISMLDYSIERLKTRNIEGIYVSPSSEIVYDYLIFIIQEILNKYSVDGIHLDYSRFPGREFVYDRNLKTDYMRKYVIGYEELNDLNTEKLFGKSGLNALKTCWQRLPKEQLNQLIKNIYTDIKAINPNVQLSSAVIADVESAEMNYYQNWWEWIANGYIDFVVVMAYSPSLNVLKKQIEKINTKTSLENVVIGLGTYNQTVFDVKANYEVLARYPVMGFCLFSNQSIYEKRGSYTYIGNTIFK